MILRHIVDMPRLYSGVDQQGRPWTCLHFPRPFGEALNRMTPEQRAKTLRGLLVDFRRTMGEYGWPN